MLKQYWVLSDCISAVRESDLDLLQRLKLEVQLIQAKRLLLQDVVSNEIDGVFISEIEFAELLRLIRQVCSAPHGAGDAGIIIARLHEMTLKLKTHLSAAVDL